MQVVRAFFLQKTQLEEAQTLSCRSIFLYKYDRTLKMCREMKFFFLQDFQVTGIRRFINILYRPFFLIISLAFICIIVQTPILHTVRKWNKNLTYETKDRYRIRIIISLALCLFPSFRVSLILFISLNINSTW